MLCTLLNRNAVIKTHFINLKANSVSISNNDKKPDNRLVYKYAGLATQLMVSQGLALFLGLKVDKWMAIKTPLLVWLLPLLVLVIVIWQIIRETSKK